MVRFYINGQLDASYPRSGTIGGTPQSENLAIGAYLYNGRFTQFVNGILDEIRISNIARTPDEFNIQVPGSVEGVVRLGEAGVPDVTVKLLDSDGMPTTHPDQITDGAGAFSFSGVEPGDYQVLIVEPLGYGAADNPRMTTVPNGGTVNVVFLLEELVVYNEARSKGYWKHQFDVHLKGQGRAHESEEDLRRYIEEIHSRYSPRFGIFSGKTSFEEWQDVLTVRRQPSMVQRAEAQLAAMLFNLMSLKLGQYMVATEDGRTVGDVLTYVSQLLTDGLPETDELAKDLAEMVNTQQVIPEGIVPAPLNAGMALRCTGVDDFVTVAHHSSLQPNNGNFTFECWIRRTADLDKQAGVIGKGAGLDVIEWQVQIHPPGGRWQFDYGNRIYPVSSNLDDMEWHHLAATVERIGNNVTIRAYLDGEPDGVASGVHSPSISNSDPLFIAANRVHDAAFIGYMDEVRLWSVARSEEEIRENMNSLLAGDEAGLVGYWRFDGDANDLSPLANHGTLNGGATFEVSDAPIGGSILYKPSSDPPALEIGRPATYALHQNYPNPFNPATTVRFDVPGPSIVLLEVYNMLGEKVATLVDRETAAGSHTVVWDASNMPSGLYLYRLKTGTFVATRRMVLVK
jgi:hypothetical protein